MCGGGGNRASDQAQRAEARRRAQIKQATTAIDRVFTGRTGQLGEFADALRAQFGAEARKQKKVADRELKFALARGGLTGGSADVDARKLLGEEFQEGLLKGERGVQASLADLAAADEASRQNLIALAQGGASLSSGTQAAARALQSNLAGAREDAAFTGLGDIFASTRDLYVKQQEAAARRLGLSESEIYSDPFGGGPRG